MNRNDIQILITQWLVINDTEVVLVMQDYMNTQETILGLWQVKIRLLV